jgi:hypothetical protein
MNFRLASEIKYCYGIKTKHNSGFCAQVREDREGYENVMVTNGERAWNTEGKIIFLPIYNIFNGTLRMDTL